MKKETKARGKELALISIAWFLAVFVPLFFFDTTAEKYTIGISVWVAAVVITFFTAPANKKILNKLENIEKRLNSIEKKIKPKRKKKTGQGKA